ncbi:MAG TPA: GreA/GreB family elongation factor [Bacteroidales bacterium]|nr:GreA/GreB family elongation factor [Bacteroidales bacterium]
MNKLDYARILKSIQDGKNRKTINAKEAENLLNELHAAKIVEPYEVPANIVTMNSIVRIKFLKTGKEIKFQIVYPDLANMKENKISIFSPVATALIGYKVSDEIDWMVPSGMTKIRIEEIVYQPEAEGNYEL